jgi:RNA polymerase sigma-70 factor (ECF subfamily)
METSTAAQAVEQLIADYGKLVFHVIYGLTHDWQGSEDLTQETFLQAFRGIDAARATSGAQFQAKAWLLRIAVNTARMQQRRKLVLRFLPFSEMGPEREALSGMEEPHAAYEQIQDDGSLETIVAERDVVQRCIERLPEALRVPLLLSIVAGFSSGEIACMMSIKEPAVRQRLSRARGLFRQFYARESGEQLQTSSLAVRRSSRSRSQFGPRSLALSSASA